jgi:hypothetical protein
MNYAAGLFEKRTQHNSIAFSASCKERIMLEEEIGKIWSAALWGLNGEVEEARKDYDFSRGPRPPGKRKCETRLWLLCDKTSKLIREHLLEALSSPNAYIREWGRLIMEEQNA